MVVDVYTVKDGVRAYWGSFEDAKWAKYHIAIAKAFGDGEDVCYYSGVEFEMEDRL